MCRVTGIIFLLSPRVHFRVMGMVYVKDKDINQLSLPTPFHFVPVCISVFVAPLSCISFPKLFQQLSILSLSSSGCTSALSVLSVYIKSLYESLL